MLKLANGYSSSLPAVVRANYTQHDLINDDYLCWTTLRSNEYDFIKPAFTFCTITHILDFMLVTEQHKTGYLASSPDAFLSFTLFLPKSFWLSVGYLVSGTQALPTATLTLNERETVFLNHTTNPFVSIHYLQTNIACQARGHHNLTVRIIPETWKSELPRFHSFVLYTIVLSSEPQGKHCDKLV
jgi:hypothetical protein